MELYSDPMTHRRLGEMPHVKGKDLTAKIREMRKAKMLICRLAFIDPVHGGKKRKIYQFIATQKILNV